MFSKGLRRLSFFLAGFVVVVVVVVIFASLPSLSTSPPCVLGLFVTFLTTTEPYARHRSVFSGAPGQLTGHWALELFSSLAQMNLRFGVCFTHWVTAEYT